ncbi:hypothetical protein FLA105534_02564 [Flavobacterium bizetiae]|uniref:Outer membrane protein beta-barrel domain-containing protein n=1 Tax=Flavobacterium bizetiae TaxID=2704140 RepID=A0A6J4GMQ5_9FLAO|nr:hypothetical protein [Flavobacterium bizetiae]CAA9199368.1 hypothetical protein FLA105534_02564 [Flavobacterium bizetiae]CAD5342719.1 hypothetical protein FLA105535_02712 [Flavobacterium bizetiae]CAD5348965.1 hypothetical protein FLA105534_02942 [Flavobacterium bizetiae]
MKKQNIEDIFSSMEDFSSVPPLELWGEIEKKLDKPKKKKRVILWWSAAACLLLGLLLPSVLHFTSNSGIKTIKTDSQQNNSVVLDEQKNNSGTDSTILNEKNKSEKIITEKESDVVNDNTSLKDKANQPQHSQKNQNQKTAIAHTDSKNTNNTDGLNSKTNTEKPNNNQAVAEKTFVTDPKNGFNSDSKHQMANADKNVSNQTSTEKTNISGKAANPNTKVQPLSDKKFSNKALAEKALAPAKTNGFNSVAKSQMANADKKASDQILAEKTFSAGKVNPFNPSSKNQVSKSIFDHQSTSKNNNAIALNPTLSNVNGNQKALYESQAKQNNAALSSEKQLANNQKSNSKFNDVLSKKDSAQLAELQNLEKGILPEDKKEKESKNRLAANDEKWAVEVFAGVASSENYKNEKTLGNTNDSRQSNSYGVKTKYKINKKWAVASGLKINELGQSVANVSYISAKNNAFFSSSDYFNQSASAALSAPITANDNYVFVPNSTSDAFKQNNIENNNLKNGNLDQNLRYIEMPLEVSYAIFSMKRASINLNTGGFVGKLISNNVALDGNSIGQNVNANDYVYGSTLSSTLQYRVYKKTNVFVEPAMNYYINPLSNQSFNQFQWGLNFGLNVSF